MWNVTGFEGEDDKVIGGAKSKWWRLWIVIVLGVEWFDASYEFWADFYGIEVIANLFERLSKRIEAFP